MLILSGSFCAVGEGWAVCGVHGEGDECVRPWVVLGWGRWAWCPLRFFPSVYNVKRWVLVLVSGVIVAGIGLTRTCISSLVKLC